MMKRRLLLILVTALVIAAAAAWLLFSNGDPAETAPRPTPVYVTYCIYSSSEARIESSGGFEFPVTTTPAEICVP
jgi:hypothetical protein